MMSLFEFHKDQGQLNCAWPIVATEIEYDEGMYVNEMEHQFSETAFLILNDAAQGRLHEAASKLQLIPRMPRILAQLEHLAELKNMKLPKLGIVRISPLLSAKPNFKWSLDEDAITRSNAMTNFVQFDNLKPTSESLEGISINVANSERTQLRYDFIGGEQSTVFIHYLIKTNFESITEPFVAIRWIHDGANEEVIVRFRSTSIVVGQSIEVPIALTDTFLQLSIGRQDGKDIVFVNGLPTLFRDAITPPPTGVTLDVIGTHGLHSKLDIPLFVVDQENPSLFLSIEEIECWFQLLIQAFSIKGSLQQLSKLLYAFAGLDACLSYESYMLALKANLKEPLGYRDYLTDALIEKLPKKLQQNALTQLIRKEPQAVILVENVTVSIASNPSLHASLGHLIGRSSQKMTLLENINFRAYRGDIVGIIGKNGAGKTTFLKTLVAAMPLSKGQISVDGRPILLRPGAGMQSDLTGRENILKTGLYMGFLPRELNELMDEIIEFAELKEHIDRPFRYYSDGMRARLVFSLATAIPRDILLLDELLSAGDMGFQRKAMKRLDAFIARAKLVFVVQHTFDFVLSRCTKCLLLEHGRPVYFGDPVIATELYKESL